MKPLAVLLLLSLGLALAGCSRGELTAEGLTAEYGLPICSVSEYDYKDTGRNGSYQISLYSVGKDAAIASLSGVPVGTLLVFTDDADLKKRAQLHFTTLDIPEEYTGITMFTTRGWRNGCDIHIVKVTGPQRFETVFEEGTSFVFFEVGTPGKLIRQPPAPRKRRPPPPGERQP